MASGKGKTQKRKWGNKLLKRPTTNNGKNTEREKVKHKTDSHYERLSARSSSQGHTINIHFAFCITLRALNCCVYVYNLTATTYTNCVIHRAKEVEKAKENRLVIFAVSIFLNTISINRVLENRQTIHNNFGLMESGCEREREKSLQNEWKHKRRAKM